MDIGHCLRKMSRTLTYIVLGHHWLRRHLVLPQVMFNTSYNRILHIKCQTRTFTNMHLKRCFGTNQMHLILIRYCTDWKKRDTNYISVQLLYKRIVCLHHIPYNRRCIPYDKMCRCNSARLSCSILCAYYGIMSKSNKPSKHKFFGGLYHYRKCTLMLQMML